MKNPFGLLSILYRVKINLTDFIYGMYLPHTLILTLKLLRNNIVINL